MSKLPLSEAKSSLAVHAHGEHEIADADSAVFAKGGTVQDGNDMHRMGKLQQLRRDFRLPSIFGYAVILGCTWEFALVIVSLSLMNGGTAGGIWMFFVVCVGMFFVVLSLAEMASMAPTAGGQYHWVSEFAPPKQQKFLSYITGWFSVIGWQAAMASTSYAVAQQLQGLIALNVPDYAIKGWQSTLFCIATALFAIIWNTILVRKLPLMEGIVMILHIFGFIVFVAVLWVLGPRSDPKVVFTEFQDNGGWGSIGLSCLVGLTGPVITLIGADSACHLSEELKDASWALPRSMIATAVLNYTLGFVMTITVMSTLGDVDEILMTPTGQPYIQVLLNATQSRKGTSVMTAVVATLLLFAAVNLTTTVSRQLFAFARDQGLPGSRWLSYVPAGWDIPLNAVIATLTITALLSLIIIGSSIAFNVLMSIGQVGTVGSYIFAISCVFRKRLVGEPLLPSRFDLGRAGLFINTIALCFLVLAFVFPFFPLNKNPTSAQMNWNILVTGFTLAVALIYYAFRGKKTYKGPVEYVRRSQ
ncbi:amino acid transporter [Zopfia rhizophila CBS 207.26]|uniref:Amino acid transporter n=1 Tax=Zopfia rhizophila CBS 207.26 TaxID=1314779 RepID=A0A6A6EN39_9PEZI|nr:amino acid transporter [Zopfia rhizophila CBS 207.26]